MTVFVRSRYKVYDMAAFRVGGFLQLA